MRDSNDWCKDAISTRSLLKLDPVYPKKKKLKSDPTQAHNIYIYIYRHTHQKCEDTLVMFFLWISTSRLILL